MGRHLLVLGLVACGCNGKDEGTGDGAITDVTCTEGAVAGVAHVTWDADLTGSATVLYGLAEDDLSMATPEVDASTGNATLLGLPVVVSSYAQVVIGEDSSEVVECPGMIPPSGTPSFDLDAWNPELACEDGGYVLFSYLGQGKSGIGIVDREARYVWSIASDDPAVQYTRTRLGRDGASVLWNTNDADRNEDIATIERISMDGLTRTSTRTINGHHDFVELPDGATFAWLSYVFQDLAVEGMPSYPDPDPIAADAIYEGPEGLVDPTGATKVFDMFEDWPGGIYDSGPDMQDCVTGFIPGYCEFSHGNSLGYVDGQDAYYGGFRWMDSTAKIGRQGDVLWILGGRDNQFAIDPEDLAIHSHFSDVWDGGMLLMDNHDPGPSRLLEYTIADSALTADVVWEHPRGDFETILGDVRRIPVDGCDNVLISWSSDGEIEELTRDGQTVWKVAFSLGQITSRVQYLSSLYDFAAQAHPE